jgi:hypothetical protein
MAKVIINILGLIVAGAIVGGVVASCENRSKSVAKAQPKSQPQVQVTAPVQTIIESIHSNTARDYWNQSITAYNHRDLIQSCVLMGISKAAALSAHDNKYYEKTLAEERSICKEAGLTL